FDLATGKLNLQKIPFASQVELSADGQVAAWIFDETLTVARINGTARFQVAISGVKIQQIIRFPTRPGFARENSRRRPGRRVSFSLSSKGDLLAARTEETGKRSLLRVFDVDKGLTEVWRDIDPGNLKDIEFSADGDSLILTLADSSM